MNKRPVQYFTAEYLERCKKLTPDQILQFLEDFRQLSEIKHEKCTPISVRIDPSLLTAFKAKAKLCNVPYQTQIKKLMREWVG